MKKTFPLSFAFMLVVLVHSSCNRSGCMDINAVNYNAKAKYMDQSCYYNAEKVDVGITGNYEVTGDRFRVECHYKSQIDLKYIEIKATHENGFLIDQNEFEFSKHDLNPLIDTVNLSCLFRIWVSGSVANSNTYYSYVDEPPFGKIDVEITVKDSLKNSWPFQFQIDIQDTEYPTIGFPPSGIPSIIDINLNSQIELNGIISDNHFLKQYSVKCYKKNDQGLNEVFTLVSDTANYLDTKLVAEEFFNRHIKTFYQLINPVELGFENNDSLFIVSEAEDYVGNITYHVMKTKIIQ